MTSAIPASGGLSAASALSGIFVSPASASFAASSIYPGIELLLLLVLPKFICPSLTLTYWAVAFAGLTPLALLLGPAIFNPEAFVHVPMLYVQALLKHIPGDLPVHIEPGRSIAANAGLFITQVLFLKPTEHRNFAVVDGAMNDLIRPSLYSAWQEIVPVTPHDADCRDWDIVGPVCETGDFLGKDRALALEAGDLKAWLEEIERLPAEAQAIEVQLTLPSRSNGLPLMAGEAIPKTVQWWPWRVPALAMALPMLQPNWLFWLRTRPIDFVRSGTCSRRRSVLKQSGWNTLIKPRTPPPPHRRRRSLPQPRSALIG